MANELLTHWKVFQNPDYLGAYAFQPNEEKVLTIDRVEVGTVYNTEINRKEQKRVMYFRERDVKPLILNTTNAKIITDLLRTPYVQQWAGRKIILVVEKVKWRKELVDGVRVKRQVIEEKQEPVFTCEICKKKIQASGTFTAQQIAMGTKSKYGKILCMDCGTKQKESTQEKPIETQEEN